MSLLELIGLLTVILWCALSGIVLGSWLNRLVRCSIARMGPPVDLTRSYEDQHACSMGKPILVTRRLARNVAAELVGRAELRN